MERFVKAFIAASMVYLVLASTVGIIMLVDPSYRYLRFAHSHLNLLGWVSMMIYGVGYHVLPRFAGKRLKSVLLGEIQFYLANIGLVGMLFFYTLPMVKPELSFQWPLALFGIMEVLSIMLFFYNMAVTLFTPEE